MILIADDSKVLRERLAGLLSTLPRVGAIAQAEDAQQALRLARELRPEVLLLDIHMPGGDGIEVLREVKNEQPDTTVIMLTNHAQEAYRERCFALGADYFISKGEGFKKLADTLEGLQPLEAQAGLKS